MCDKLIFKTFFVYKDVKYIICIIDTATWRMSWRRDVMWLHSCILAPRSTFLILSGSRCCRQKVLRYRSSNSWMISTVRSTTP